MVSFDPIHVGIRNLNIIITRLVSRSTGTKIHSNPDFIQDFIIISIKLKEITSKTSDDERGDEIDWPGKHDLDNSV